MGSGNGVEGEVLCFCFCFIVLLVLFWLDGMYYPFIAEGWGGGDG